jgi:TM2 domain-containing membrane protein YozV
VDKIGAHATHPTDPSENDLSMLHPIIRSKAMAGQGSAGNVLAALCSFFIPGLGQLLQGRLVMAIVQFCLAAILWFVLLGWIIHLWSILDAALFKPGK